MFSEQDLWGDAPQLQLHCLIEGESSIITIEVPGNMIISFVKDFIHEKGINTVRTIPSKDLSLLKVSRTSQHVAAHFLRFIRSI